MHWKLLAGCACSVALLLGACSSSNNTAAGTTGGSGSGTTGGSGDENGNGGNGGGGTELPPIPEETRAADAVKNAIARATAAAAQGATAERSRALEEIAAARELLNDAVAAARKAVTDAEKAVDANSNQETNDAYGKALRIQMRVTKLKNDEDKKLNAAEDPLLWFRDKLLRQNLPSGTPRVPADATNVATVTRTARTKDTSDTDPTQIAGTVDAVIKSDDFKANKYEAGETETVFSRSGDEFKVNGYVSGTTTEQNLNIAHKTGLKLTSAGLEIRAGGAVGTGTGIDSFTGDFLDMRKKIDTAVGTGISSGGWDLTIMLDRPRPEPGGTKGVSSWNGNGDFYWRAIAPADPDQLDQTKTASYTANTYTQPTGYKDLGTYEVWLSNHIGVDKGLEPVEGESAVCRDGVRRTSCPDDDVNRYLDYAAYGMFVFMPEVAIGAAIPTDRGRIQSMHFGYEAFTDETGKKTTDISKEINAKFHGYSIATAFRGNRVRGGTAPSGTNFETKLLRGEVELTVKIPKSGSGTVSGMVDSFAEWNGAGAYWHSHTGTNGFTVSFDNGTIGEAMSIGDGGVFTGTARLTVGTGSPPFTVGNADAVTELNNQGVGQVTGTFYGPRSDPDNLEAAGSWIVGHPAASPENDHAEWKIIGSFGAKKRASATSN